jgi:hypothetical protein
MTLLSTLYASAPTDQVRIRTLEIKPAGVDPIRVCAAFEDMELTLETSETVTFTGAHMEIAEPVKNTSGQQSLRFAFANVTAEAQKAVEAALESGQPVSVIYRVYLSGDTSAPAYRPAQMTMVGGTFDDLMMNVEAGYFEILNQAWPRKRYTTEIAPGIRYIA